MRLRRRYNLPELLTLLSYGDGNPGLGAWKFAQQPGGARLRQVIQLAREGLREYNHRLDDLERNVAPGSYASRRDDTRDNGECERADGDVIEAEAAEPAPITRHEIHRLFERLAIQRHVLNSRGYPYTGDVNEEREKVYPASELLDGRDVEVAWDDWRNEDGKSLFRANRRDTDNARDREHDRVETRGRAKEPILREELEVFSRMLRDAVERAFESFDRSRGYREQDSRNVHSREPRPSPDAERVFQVFDEMLLTSDRGTRFTTDNLPKFTEVNSRLVERGESVLDDEAALRREWMAYLVKSAFARDEKVRDRRPNGGASVSREDPLVDVEVDATVIERESDVGKGRKRKPV
jgi:hypothetical protein